tara:strand:- start:1597 stop:1776 length:180 start_codon:yes stop_codon:yes gene_type:complete
MDLKIQPRSIRVKRGTTTYRLDRSAIEEILSRLGDAELLEMADHVEVQYTVKDTTGEKA